MADTTPNGYGSSSHPHPQPASVRSSKSTSSIRSGASNRPSEQTPLLAASHNHLSGDDEFDRDHEAPQDSTPSATSSLLANLSVRAGQVVKNAQRWPSAVALVLLCSIAAIIMLAAFITPEALQEYAVQAADFKATKLALANTTGNGVQVLVEGDFSMDASRVDKKSVRDLGIFGTWVAREAETGPAVVDVFLPAYGNVLVGSAKVPSVKVDIRNGHTTHVNLIAELQPRSPDGIRTVVNDWIEGRLGEVKVDARATVPIRSGIINLGKQSISHSLVVKGSRVPSLPKFDITKLNFDEIRDDKGGMLADVNILVKNQYPVEFTVPALGFDVMVQNCAPQDPYIRVGEAVAEPIRIEPEKDISVDVIGKVRELPSSLTSACPSTGKSPLDAFLSDYIHGEDSTVYVKCCNFPGADTPAWMKDLLSDITVPVPFKGSSFDHLIKNFSLTDVHFYLPEFAAAPNTIESQPKISATVQAIVGLPKQMNFPLNVTKVRADADVYYHNKKMGRLDLHQWQMANSTQLDPKNGDPLELLVQANINKAPLEILDEDVFSEVVSTLIFGGKPVVLGIKASVDVGVDTPIGEFAIAEIPAEGLIPVKPMSGPGQGHGLESLAPAVNDLKIVGTDPNSLTIRAIVNFTNPTKYAATIPYVSINVLCNDTILAHGIAEDIYVAPGNNSDIPLEAIWDPFGSDGAKGKAVGKEFLSQYLSSYNTTLTLRTSNNTIPAQPTLGEALSVLSFNLPAPKIHMPKDPGEGDGDDDGEDDDDDMKFIKQATMHLISSTATFTLNSPLKTTTLFIDRINATAYYRDDPVATILYDLPFAVKPGVSDSPRIPVQWSIGSVGYEAVRKALGGQLKLDAKADIDVRIGKWRENIWVHGKGIGSLVRL